MMLFPKNMQCSDARAPGLSFHDPIPVDTSVLNFSEHELQPINGMRSTPYRFDLQAKTGSDVIDLSKTMLELKLKVVNADGSNVVDNAELALAGNPISTLWKKIEVRLNDKLINIESSSRNIAQKGTIEEWFRHRQEDDRSVALALPEANNNGSNANDKWRTMDFQNGNLVQFLGPPPVDFLKVNNFMSPRNILSLAFHPEDNNKVVLNAKKSGYRVVIAHMILHIRCIHVAVSTTKHVPQLDSDVKEVYYSRFGCVKDYQIPKGTLHWSQHVITGDGRLPKYALIGLVSRSGTEGAAADGKKTKGPCYFEHFQLAQCSIRAGEKYYPNGSYKPMYNNNDDTSSCVREYYGLYDQLGLVHHYITPNHFVNGGAFLLPFNFTADMRSCLSRDLLASKPGPLTIDLTFGTELPETINLFVYMIYDQTISIEGTTGYPVEEQF